MKLYCAHFFWRLFKDVDNVTPSLLKEYFGGKPSP